LLNDRVNLHRAKGVGADTDVHLAIHLHRGGRIGR
jgi:hypothetical protein